MEDKHAITDSRTYEGWWDLSLIDERNERPLHVAFVAVIAIWATAPVRARLSASLITEFSALADRLAALASGAPWRRLTG